MLIQIPIPAKKKFDVVGLGLNAVDHLCVLQKFPEYGSKTKMLSFTKQGGGQVATALTALQRWGLKTLYIGKIGSDEMGEFSIESLRLEGVNCDNVIIEEGASSQFAFIIVDKKSGERTIIWDRDKKLFIEPDCVKKEVIQTGRVCHLDGHEVPASIQAAKFAKEAKIPVVLDAERVKEGTDELVSLTDILISSEEFPKKFTGEEKIEDCLKTINERGPKFVCSTLGKKGAKALYEDNFFYSPGFEVDAIDTTGAGDIFHAAFIWGFLERWHIEDILRFSNAVAALNCTALGGRVGIPTIEEVNNFIRKLS